MSRIQSNRASYQSIGNIRIGKRPSANRPSIIATMSDTQAINKMTALLADAKNTTSVSHYLYNLSEVERLSRKIVKDRL